MTAPVRAALYLRVSTGRQADNDLSIPDQRRQASGYCTSRGWEIVADYVEPGVSATDDRRPEFQRNYGDSALNTRAVIAIHLDCETRVCGVSLTACVGKSAMIGVDGVFRSGAPDRIKLRTLMRLKFRCECGRRRVSVSTRSPLDAQHWPQAGRCPISAWSHVRKSPDCPF